MSPANAELSGRTMLAAAQARARGETPTGRRSDYASIRPTPHDYIRQVIGTQMVEAAYHLRYPRGNTNSPGVFRERTGRAPLPDEKGGGAISYEGPLYKAHADGNTIIAEPSVLRVLFHPAEPPNAEPEVVAVVFSMDGGFTADFADPTLPVEDIASLRPRYSADNPLDTSDFHADKGELVFLINHTSVHEK